MSRQGEQPSMGSFSKKMDIVEQSRDSNGPRQLSESIIIQSYQEGPILTNGGTQNTGTPLPAPSSWGPQNFMTPPPYKQATVFGPVGGHFTGFTVVHTYQNL